MTAKTINLSFNGYWREENIKGVPAESGIYLTYSCKYDEVAKTVDLTKLIYIGESENVNERIANHNKWEEWRKFVPKGEQICFAFAKVANPDRERAQCALIYTHKPVCCEQSTSSFDYDETTVISETARKEITLDLIKSPITVKRTSS